jgi:radical SAM protein with 4Fe4S-binding SPASM domain
VLSAEDWQQILTQIAPDAENLKITGGEPTLHPEFEDIVQSISDMGISFTIFTNGRWQNPEKLTDFLSKLPSDKFGLLVSLHGPDSISHEAFTNTPGSFTETCRNIRLMTDAGLHVHTSTVITCQNYNLLSEMAKLSRSLKARRAVFNRYLGPAFQGIEPGDDQLRQAVHNIEELRRSYGSDPNFAVRYGNCIPQCFTPSSSTGCWAGAAYCTIDPWGNVRPCNHSPTIAGNILETPIEEIWQNDIMQRWRELTPKKCSTCSELDVCHGGCKALVEIRQRDPLIRKPLHETKPPMELELYERSKPRLVGKTRPEAFGYALVRGQSIVPVVPETKAFLDQLDGSRTMMELSESWGQDAIDLIGLLYLQGQVEMQE